MLPQPAPPVLLYDGTCALCDASVRALLALDRGQRFRFAALESRVAGELLRDAGVAAPGVTPGTVVLLMGGRAFVRSSAAVRVLLALGVPWSWLGALLWLCPKPLRDALYDVVAANRTRWFGRLESCRVPTPAERERFLDAGEPPPR